MKRFSVVLLIIILCFTLAACGGTPAAQQSAAKDVRNADELYVFVNSEVYELSREDFNDRVDITYLDVTNDGKEEAILVNNNDWSAKIAIVGADGGQFKHIGTELPIAKYANKFELKDGFLALTQKTGGTGVQEEYLSLAVYSEGKMVTVLDGLKTAETLSQPSVSYEDISDIKGSLTNFEYSLQRIEGDKVKTIRKTLYAYNKDKLAFDVTEVESGNSQDNGTGLDGSKPSLKSEKHREAFIYYDKYDLVVIDSYGGGSLSSLGYYEYKRPGFKAESGDGNGYGVRDIAIVGEVFDLYYHSASSGKDYKIADQFGNKILVITDDLSGDKSSISFKDKSGYEYSLDMFGEGEQFETILVKGDNRQFLGTNDREAKPGDRTELADFSGQSAVELSKLKNGDSIGAGLIIKNIEYQRPWEKARFTLEGNVVLTGELLWEEQIANEPLFIADESAFPTAIVIGDPKDSLFGTIEYKPTRLYIWNSDEMQKALSKSTLQQLKSGRSLYGKIGIKDIKVNIYLGSEGGTDCEFTEIVDLRLK
ncbi:MAG: hypothetical protein FH756_13320 [Firmicutes bacterium]|nr:hypothetical protein [Bacillota bacterium]